MRQIILIIFLFSSLIFPQSWDTKVETEISASNVLEIEDFVNKDGIHVVTRNSSSEVNYYNLSIDGDINYSTSITSSGQYVNIVGDMDNLYILYMESGYVKIKKSTNEGVNWGAAAGYNTSNSNHSGLDAYFDGYDIHVAYSVTETIYNHVYYNVYSVEYDNWEVNSTHITDGTGEYGQLPSITGGDGKIHISYYQNSDYIRSRTKNVTWGTTQTVLDASSEGTVLPRTTIWGGSDKLHCGFFYNKPGYNYIKTKSREYGTSNWGDDEFSSNSAIDLANPSFVELENGDIFITYSVNVIVAAKYNGSTWGDFSTLSTDYVPDCKGIHSSAINNDIYTVWRESESNFLQLGHFDSAPAIPSNFSATFTSSHPVVSWSLNQEIDIKNYKIYKSIKNETWWRCEATVDSATTSWTDTDVDVRGKFDPNYTIYYKVTAVDKNNESDYTDVDSVNGTTNVFWKHGADIADGIKEYKLYDNYPNPFNPTTNIAYQLPVDGYVTLKVYDMVGREVAELVNEGKESGIYETEFNASNLASGVYVYRLQVFSSSSKNSQVFMATNKLMLLK